MSMENVKAFYQRLAQDEQFRSELEKVKNKQECSQFVQKAGYYFTQEELENYTSDLLESSLNEDGLTDLNERELETVIGGAIKPYILPWDIKLPLYGVPTFPDDSFLL